MTFVGVRLSCTIETRFETVASLQAKKHLISVACTDFLKGRAKKGGHFNTRFGSQEGSLSCFNQPMGQFSVFCQPWGHFGTLSRLQRGHFSARFSHCAHHYLMRMNWSCNCGNKNKTHWAGAAGGGNVTFTAEDRILLDSFSLHWTPSVIRIYTPIENGHKCSKTLINLNPSCFKEAQQVDTWMLGYHCFYLQTSTIAPPSGQKHFYSLEMIINIRHPVSYKMWTEGFQHCRPLTFARLV